MKTMNMNMNIMLMVSIWICIVLNAWSIFVKTGRGKNTGRGTVEGFGIPQSYKTKINEIHTNVGQINSTDFRDKMTQAMRGEIEYLLRWYD